ncbi:Glu-tRNA(Gln) amidotransferase GatDE subunit D [Candidatus Woesearchaeota archaeon]|jgi:glutamyl-tRNA(Gln) amidotransferase subunit D|nr:Glu-tRNA(Gln) amidotransferase GatDE subunit D [Candidatus Woesearchaeota archaeon]
MVKAGDKVKIFYKEEVIEGVLMPEEKGFVNIKLISGYNIGLNKRNVKKIVLVKAKKKDKKVKKIVVKKKNIPTISILHTGGTIASKVDYETGAVLAKFEPEELMDLFPEIKNLANINSRLIANIMSEDMRFSHYNLLAKKVAKEIKKGVKGVIITHGTDTLHYTSAALSFILKNLPVPILFVGAQRSSDRGSSDSALNLISAVTFITNTDYRGVAICMHENTDDKNSFVINGCKARKMHSSRRDAFRPINSGLIARVNNEKKNIKYFKKSNLKKGKFCLKLFNDKLKVGLLKLHTNMFSEEFLVFKNFNGLVIEGTGLGHAPITEQDLATKEHSKILGAVKLLAKKMPVVMTSQTIYGRVNMNVYSPGRKLQDAGVFGSYADMTSETAFIKLVWLLSNHKKDVKKLFSKNLRGEISERSEEEDFLV